MVYFLHHTLQLLFIIFFSFLSPLAYVLHFIVSYSHHKFLNTFCFQVTLFSILQRQTLLPPLVSCPCFSQQKRLVSVVVIHSKQTLVTASPPFLEKCLKFLLKLLGAEWWQRVCSWKTTSISRVAVVELQNAQPLTLLPIKWDVTPALCTCPWATGLVQSTERTSGILTVSLLHWEQWEP